MLHLLLSFFLAFLTPSHSKPTVHHNTSQVTTLDDTGGETGHYPPTKPTKP